MALPYDPSVILSIASLETAHQSVTAHPKFDEFLSEYRKLATDCELNDHYGVTLVHRHAHVNESQRLFDFKQTLQPFTISQDAHNLHGCPISPKSLSLQAGRWMPYEYELGHYENLDAEFLAKVKTLIERFDVNNVGLRRYPPDDPEELEVTDCAGISVKIPWESSSNELEDYVTTFWAYPSGQPKTYRCACTDTGSATSPNHNHIDQP